MSTCSEGYTAYTTRLQLPHWAERSDIYVHFHTTESLGGDDLYNIPAGCNFSFQCNKLKKKFLFKQKIVIVPLTGQVL